MSVIQALDWDSRLFGLPVGRYLGSRDEPGRLDLQGYSLVVARVPQQTVARIGRLQTLGFRYIGLDLRLVSEPDEQEAAGNTHWRTSRISHRDPDFTISGFQIPDSRLMLDPECRVRLPANFWDQMIHEHCRDFADMVICATDAENHLTGFVSCLVRPPYLDLFMVAVHPAFQGKGIGEVLLREAAILAHEKDLQLSTSVMASNTRGLNFYMKHNYRVESGEVIMHYWQDGIQNVQ